MKKSFASIMFLFCMNQTIAEELALTCVLATNQRGSNNFPNLFLCKNPNHIEGNQESKPLYDLTFEELTKKNYRLMATTPIPPTVYMSTFGYYFFFQKIK